MPNMPKRIAFLFGAGAEGKDNYNLPNGFEYMKSTILGDKKDFLKALNSRFTPVSYDKIYFNNTYKHSKYQVKSDRILLRRIILAKLLNNPDDCDFFNKGPKDIANEIRLILTDDDINELKESDNKGLSQLIYEIEQSKKKSREAAAENQEAKKQEDKKRRDNRDNILDEFLLIAQGRSLGDKINSSLLKALFFNEKSNNKPIDNFSIGIAGLLDGYFHTIINPQKYGINNFSKVFNYYWSCYFTIVEGIIKHLSANSQLSESLLEYTLKVEHKNIALNHEKILQNIESFTEVLYKNKPEHDTSKSTLTYYEAISNELKSNVFECTGVATTNYYPFVEAVGAKKMLYLNGSLNLLEFPELLEVHDLLKCEYKLLKNRLDSNIFFPFIFGQSHVKPIVNHHQIKQFYELDNMLKKSDILIILGFNINEDDNHINAFLHDFLMQKNKLIVVVSRNNAKFPEEQAKELNNKLNEITNRLKCSDECAQKVKIFSCEYGDNEKLIIDLFDFLKTI